MDLTAWLLRRAPARALIVTTPGGTRTRLATEQWAREHGWRTARSPAEANLMVVAGPAGTDLAPYLDLAWSSMPAPRVRAHVQDVHDVAGALTAAEAALRDTDLQRGEARHAARFNAFAQSSAHDHNTGGEMRDSEPSMSCGSSMSEHDHDGHHGHDMAGMKMPGDVPMADRADDRDGLKLDQLNLPLGPVLTDWPPGLVVHATMQGDVIQHAHVELLGEHPEDPLPPLVRRLDNAARLLSVAGWPDMAAQARLLRDKALDGVPSADLTRWASRLRRSRSLRWLLAGVGQTEAGDALTRLHDWLDGSDPATTAFDALPALLEGTELATARLVVASLDLRVGAHG